MKKSIKFLVMIFVLIFICACGKSSTYEVSLSGNSNSYYNWVYEIEDDTILKIEEEKYYGDESKDEIKALGGNYIFKLKSLKTGKTKVSFFYKKTWEDKDILYKYIIEFEVDNNLKIEKLSESGNYLSLMKFFDYNKEKLGFEGDFTDYKLIFDKEIISIKDDECHLLNIYDYNNSLINVYGISIKSNNIYKMVNGKLELIK